ETCSVRTWTERAAAIRPRAVLTQRARAEACRRVGKDAHAVAAVSRDLGVGWATIMRAVADHGTPLVEDPTRLDGVAALGLDETSFLKAWGSSSGLAPPCSSEVAPPCVGPWPVLTAERDRLGGARLVRRLPSCARGWRAAGRTGCRSR